MKRVGHWWCTLVVAVLFSVGCAPPPSNFPYAQEPDPRTEEYVIGVPDVLLVRIWGHSALDSEHQVRPDGTITLPLIGDVAAAGMTPSQLKDHVTKRLNEFIKTDKTSVSVAVTEIRSYRVTVSGNVQRPGVLETAHYITVGEAIALAGGPNRFADSARAEIVRTRKDGSVVRIPVRYDALMEGRMLDQDLVLLRGDLIFVP